MYAITIDNDEWSYDDSIRIKQEKEKYIDYIQDELKYWYEEERKEDVMIIERINCLKEKV